MAPPLSVTGTWQSLRWPEGKDFLLSAKAYLAVCIALYIGFSQGLQNPYWAGLTVYVALMQPSAGAIRSKAGFRLIGTIIGGLIALVLAGLFADHIGVFLAVLIAIIGLASFLRGIDRTPTNYLWFLTGLTPGIVCLANLQQPGQIFSYATTRVAEISLGILAITAVDSLFWPQPLLPGFLETIDGWRGKAQEWLHDVLSREEPGPPDAERRRELRDKLRELTGLIATLDSQSVLLPFDIVAVPPRRRDLNLLRRLVIGLVADLAAIEVWAQALRGAPEHSLGLRRPIRHLLGHIDRNAHRNGQADRPLRDALAAEIDGAIDASAGRVDRQGLIERGMLIRLASVLRQGDDLAVVVQAISDGARPPQRLASVKVKPARSIDYLASARDALPMMVAMSVVGGFWYLTAWSGGTTALLFSFVGCMFLGTQPEIFRSAGGVTVWIGIAFALDFLYQFAVLPRVTAFPVLIGVIGAALLPLGLFFTMSMAGLLVCVFTFSLLGLQNAYSADFAQSLQSMGGSFAGLLVAAACLHLLNYDKAAFTARRTVKALRLDVVDIATARWMPSRERFLELTVDRLAQLFNALDEESNSELLEGAHVVDSLRVGANLLTLRRYESSVPADVRDMLTLLRKQVAVAFRRSLRAEGDRSVLHRAVRTVTDRIAAGPELPHRAELLVALVGLELAVDPAARDRADDSSTKTGGEPHDA